MGLQVGRHTWSYLGELVGGHQDWSGRQVRPIGWAHLRAQVSAPRLLRRHSFAPQSRHNAVQFCPEFFDLCCTACFHVSVHVLQRGGVDSK